MGYYKKRNYKKKNYKKKKYSYYNRRNSGTVVTNVARPLIGNRLITKLRYSEKVTLDPTAGVIAYHQFNANDLRDPNRTGTGHQPMGFDELMGFYEKFTVLSIKASVIVGAQTTSGSAGNTIFGLAMRPADAALSGIDPSTIMEQNNTVWNVVGPTTGTGIARLSYKRSLKNFLGVKNLEDAAENSGTSSASPTNVVVMNLWSIAQDEASNADSLPYTVTLEYIALFTEPIQMLGS